MGRTLIGLGRLDPRLLSGIGGREALDEINLRTLKEFSKLTELVEALRVAVAPLGATTDADGNDLPLESEGLATAVPAAIAKGGAVGSSEFAARGDHTHAGVASVGKRGKGVTGNIEFEGQVVQQGSRFVFGGAEGGGTYQYGLAANRPAATAELDGVIYYSTDTDILEYCDGTSWLTLDINAEGNLTTASTDTDAYLRPDGAGGVEMVRSALDRALDGAILETIDIDVVEDTGAVELHLQASGGGDLTCRFAGASYTLDCTPAQELALTLGTDIAPQLNYVYITESGGSLTLEKSTTGFPATAHCPVATVLVQSAASVATDGAYKVHAWTDHVYRSTENGHVSHVNAKLRAQPATWIDGVAPSDLVVSSPDAYVSVTAGNIYQLHPHTFPAIDMQSPAPVFLVNDPTTAYKRVTTFDDITQDASGGAINLKHFPLVLWGCVSEDEADCKLFVNLPTGTYNTAAEANADADGKAVYTIPEAFTGTGFLIARYSVRGHDSGAWVQNEKVDLRGLLPSTAAGGSGVGAHDLDGAAHTMGALTLSTIPRVDSAAASLEDSSVTDTGTQVTVAADTDVKGDLDIQTGAGASVIFLNNLDSRATAADIEMNGNSLIGCSGDMGLMVDSGNASGASALDFFKNAAGTSGAARWARFEADSGLNILGGTASPGASLELGQNSTVNNPSLRLNSGTTRPSSTQNGDIWTMDNQNLTEWHGGSDMGLLGTMFVGTGAVTVENTTSEISILPSGGSLFGTKTFAADHFVVNRGFRCTLWGGFDIGGGGNLTIRAKLGSTLLVGPALTGLTVSPGSMRLTVDTACRSVGASGSFVSQIRLETGNVSSDQSRVVYSFSTVNTTTSQAFDITVQFATASAQNVISMQACEGTNRG